MTVFPSMESADGKLRRAKQHLESFRDKVSALEDADSHTFVVEDDADATQYVFKVRGIEPTDPDLGFLAGDCIHNLRTALDHLVFQLAILGQTGQELTEAEARSCSFPVYDDPSKFPHPGKSSPIKLLRGGEQTRITELQPFNAWDPSIWGLTHQGLKFRRMYPAQLPGQLKRLADLDNIDKHRTVHATWRGTSLYMIQHPPSPFRGCTNRLATFRTWQLSKRLNSLRPAPCHVRYSPIGASS